MRAHVRYEDLESLSVEVLMARLEQRGFVMERVWEKDGEKREAYYQRDGVDVVLPLQPRFRDYGLRVGEVVERLAEIERRCPCRLVESLLEVQRVAWEILKEGGA